MKLSMYFNYTSRSLVRGGQRTVLAFFCVGVGVMAIVALQLVGLMINNAMTANVRNANGGDINVSIGVGSRAFNGSDPGYFAQLKRSGAISNYTAYSSLTGSLSTTVSMANSLTVLVVDPATFPLVTPPVFRHPVNGSMARALVGNGAIIDQKIADANHKQLGNTLILYLSNGQQAAQLVPVRITGIVTDSGVLAQNANVIVLSQAYYQQAFPLASRTFTTIDITTANDAQTRAVARQITNQYPLVTVQTAAQALSSAQGLSDTVKKFLEIAGLLALLIGGVGIVNTMQVLLSRRKIEIAMLKTTGYRCLDLSALFGLEAGLLGLIGGVLGSVAGIGISYTVRSIVEQVFSLDIPFRLNWAVISGGVLIGLFTALIFGLLPIVQSANIRPLNVIRELPEHRRAGSVLLTMVLLLLLSVLFCVMSVVILNDPALGIGVVYGTFAFLIILSGFFTLVTFLVSLLPVPEHWSAKYLILISGGSILSILLALVVPAIGFLLLALSLLGIFVVWMPRLWKVNIRMALRNIGRQRARTTTTLLALFVGIFTIGLILVLGQNVRDLINNSISNVLTYNVFTSASGSEALALRQNAHSIPGMENYEQSYVTEMAPGMINGRPLTQMLRGVPQYSGAGTLGRYGVLGILSTLNGYDLATGNLPPASQLAVTISAGRDLNTSDVGKKNIVIPEELVSQAPLKGKLNVGGTITVSSYDGKSSATLTVVGIYRSKGFNLNGRYLYGSREAVVALSPGGVLQTDFSFKIATNEVTPALTKIGRLAPHSQSFNLANLGDYVNQYLNDIVLVLIVIASLSLLAGVIIIANAVALAMLERRRELGILKSVGYTSRAVLGEVLIENAIIGGLAALLAMLLVTFVTRTLGTLAFKNTFSVNGIVLVSLVAGSALLAGATALLVAWRSARVRPLAVLRYE
ncbi:MAG TPA: FtsX-like permease family protein [Ktedonobacteraceae bacterium]